VCKNFATVFNYAQRGGGTRTLTLVKGELICADNKAEHNEGRGIVSMQSKDKGKSLFIVFLGVMGNPLGGFFPLGVACYKHVHK
jgi:hypothetical protein